MTQPNGSDPIMKPQCPPTCRQRLILLIMQLAIGLAAAAAEPRPDALVHFTGADFQGGAKDLFGSNIDGEQVNYVYALPTGAHATMKVTFRSEERRVGKEGISR